MSLGMSVRAEKGHSLYEDSWVLSRGRRGRVGGMAGGLPSPLRADTVLRGTVKTELGSNPICAISGLCDPRSAAQSFWASVFCEPNLPHGVARRIL